MSSRKPRYVILLLFLLLVVMIQQQFISCVRDIHFYYVAFMDMQFSIQASEIASRINQKKEMGCKAFDVVYFEQDGPNDSRVFRALGSEGTAIIKGNFEYHCFYFPFPKLNKTAQSSSSEDGIMLKSIIYLLLNKIH